MNSARTAIAATALATTVGLSACGGSSSSAHSSSTVKKTPISAASPSSSSTSSTPAAAPTVSALLTTMQSNLKNTKTLHIHATGRDFNGELLHNGSQDVVMDIEGSTTGDPNATTLKTGDATVQVKAVSGVHYIKANSVFWKSTLSAGSSSAAAQRAQRYTDKWVTAPASATGFNSMSLSKLLSPLLSANLTGQLTETNTTVNAVDLHGTAAWKLADKKGPTQLWVSQKTGELLELKYGANPTSDTPLNDFTFSDVNKDFHITAPADAITP